MRADGVLRRIWALDDGGTKADLAAVREAMGDLEVDELFRVRDTLIEDRQRHRGPLIRWVDQYIEKRNKYQ